MHISKRLLYIIKYITTKHIYIKKTIFISKKCKNKHMYINEIFIHNLQISHSYIPIYKSAILISKFKISYSYTKFTISYFYIQIYQSAIFYYTETMTDTILAFMTFM